MSINAAVIENGTVTNVISVDSLDFMPGLVNIQDGYGIGDLYDVNTNTFSKPVAQVIIPTTVTMRQARLVLLQEDLLDSVEAAVAAGSRADQITWEFATEVKRSDSLTQNLAQALNLTEEDLDRLFLLASNL